MSHTGSRLAHLAAAFDGDAAAIGPARPRGVAPAERSPFAPDVPFESAPASRPVEDVAA